MPPIVMKIGSDFSEQAARAAVQEAHRSWRSMQLA
jgi:hypothetical protein